MSKPRQESPWQEWMNRAEAPLFWPVSLSRRLRLSGGIHGALYPDWCAGVLVCWCAGVLVCCVHAWLLGHFSATTTGAWSFALAIVLIWVLMVQIASPLVHNAALLSRLGRHRTAVMRRSWCVSSNSWRFVTGFVVSVPGPSALGILLYGIIPPLGWASAGMMQLLLESWR